MKKYLDDLFILAGCGLVIFATAKWSEIAALYVSGVLLIGFGIYTGLVQGKKG